MVISHESGVPLFLLPILHGHKSESDYPSRYAKRGVPFKKNGLLGPTVNKNMNIL
jgi:hypothetical protein